MFNRLNRAGDTLIEVMLATAILSFVLVSSYALVSRATRIGVAAREQSQAVYYLQQQAEIAKTVTQLKWDESQSTSGSYYFDPSSWAEKSGTYSPEEGSGVDYKISYTKTKLPINTNQADQIIYKITANWTSAVGGVDRSSAIILKVNRP